MEARPHPCPPRKRGGRRLRQQPLRGGEYQQADEAADQGAVDADVLQVLADLQLEPVDEGGGVASTDFEVRGETAEGALEAVADVEGDAAGGETVVLVAGGRGDEAGKMVLESTR